MNPLKKLFLNELADQYDAEKQLIRAMPKMAANCTCKDMQKLLQAHLMETVGHVRKLDQVFASMGEQAAAKQCETTRALLTESAEVAVELKGSPAINAALISAAQKIEHHEIAAYGCLHEWASLLGNQEASALLKEILADEKAMNRALIALARSRCNNAALSAGHETESGCAGKKAPALAGGMAAVR